MPKAKKGRVMLQVQISEEARTMLERLAGSPKRKGEFLEKLIREVYGLDDNIRKAERTAREQILAAALFRAQGDDSSYSS